MVSELEKSTQVLLYDGVCVLCNATVNFLLKRDRSIFKYSSLQGKTAEAIRQRHPELQKFFNESVVLVQNFETPSERVLFCSDAILIALSEIGGFWHLASSLQVVPKFIRDGLYNFIARNRYQWFGKYTECPLPDPEVRSRFLP